MDLAEHDSDKRIQRDDEYSDSEDEGDAGRRDRQSHRQSSKSKSKSPFVPTTSIPLASSSASATAPTSAPVATDTAPLPSNVTCGAEEPLPPPTSSTSTSTTTGVPNAESAPIDAALAETAPQAEIHAGLIADPEAPPQQPTTTDAPMEDVQVEMPVQGTSADRMTAQGPENGEGEERR